MQGINDFETFMEKICIMAILYDFNYLKLKTTALGTSCNSRAYFNYHTTL
jgi:hypothetical protein